MARGRNRRLDTMLDPTISDQPHTGAKMQPIVVIAGNLRSPHLPIWECLLAEEGVGLLRVNTHPRRLGIVSTLRLLASLVCMRRTIHQMRRKGHEVLVQAHGAGRAGVLATTILDSRPCVVVHGSEVLQARSQSRLRLRATAAVLSRSRSVIITSEATRNEVLSLAIKSPPRITLVHPGIDWNAFAGAWADRPSGSAQTLLSIRRILPLYQIVEIIEAFQRVHTAMEARLTLLQGDVTPTENYVAGVRAIAALDERIILQERFLDRAGLVEVYKHTDIALSLAQTDQLSSSILEALASGCVVIVSDLPAYAALSHLNSLIRVPLPLSTAALRDAMEEAMLMLGTSKERSGKARHCRAVKARVAFESRHRAMESLLDVMRSGAASDS